MPFKPIAEPEDYPERHQTMPRHWVEEHQEKNLREALGGELWDYLERTTEERDGCPLP